LAMSQITSLLRERPLSTSEIAEILGLSSSEVSKHLNSSSRQGLVRYDVNRKCYASLKVNEQTVDQGKKQTRKVTMDKDRIDQIIDKHHGEASSLIQVLLEIQE